MTWDDVTRGFAEMDSAGLAIHADYAVTLSGLGIDESPGRWHFCPVYLWCIAL